MRVAHMQAQGGTFRVVKLDGKAALEWICCGCRLRSKAVDRGKSYFSSVLSAFERSSFALSRLVSSSVSVNLNMSSLYFLPARLLTQSPSNGSGQASSSHLLCCGFIGRDIKMLLGGS